VIVHEHGVKAEFLGFRGGFDNALSGRFKPEVIGIGRTKGKLNHEALLHDMMRSSK
jgi:hypothetical protein